MAGEDEYRSAPIVLTSQAPLVAQDQANIRCENSWIKLMTRLKWYPANMPPNEKHLVLKLDLMILVYGCLCFFTKYLSQAALTNAYVTYAVFALNWPQV